MLILVADLADLAEENDEETDANEQEHRRQNSPDPNEPLAFCTS